MVHPQPAAELEKTWNSHSLSDSNPFNGAKKRKHRAKLKGLINKSSSKEISEMFDKELLLAAPLFFLPL